MYTVVVRAHVGRLDADALYVFPGAQEYRRKSWNVVNIALVFALAFTVHIYILFDAIKLSPSVLTKNDG